MIAKIIISIYLLLWLVGIVLLLPQLIIDNRITNILCIIGNIVLLLISIVTFFLVLVMSFCKLWGC